MANCALCGCKVGAFAQKVPLTDGVICNNCIGLNKLTPVPSRYQNASSDAMQQYVKDKKQYDATFHRTDGVNRFQDIFYIQIDENNRLVKTLEDYFRFEDMLSFELQEDGEVLTKGGIGRAVTGGMLFGAAGAIVGGITGRKAQPVCSSMRIRISLKHPVFDTIYITFISSNTQKISAKYRRERDAANSCIAILQNVINMQNSNATAGPASTSAADEILKFKQLLDSEIITQEEFEAKKKQLLGL